MVAESEPVARAAPEVVETVALHTAWGRCSSCLRYGMCWLALSRSWAAMLFVGPGLWPPLWVGCVVGKWLCSEGVQADQVSEVRMVTCSSCGITRSSWVVFTAMWSTPESMEVRGRSASVGRMSAERDACVGLRRLKEELGLVNRTVRPRTVLQRSSMTIRQGPSSREVAPPLRSTVLAIDGAVMAGSNAGVL